MLKQFSIISSNINKEIYFAYFNSKPMTQFQFSNMLNKAEKFQIFKPLITKLFLAQGKLLTCNQWVCQKGEIPKMGRQRSTAYKPYICPFKVYIQEYCLRKFKCILSFIHLHSFNSTVAIRIIGSYIVQTTIYSQSQSIKLGTTFILFVVGGTATLGKNQHSIKGVYKR